MAITLKKIQNTDLTAAIFNKGFTIQKVCTKDNEGLILSVSIGFLDALILTQNTEYNNSIFFKKAIKNFQENESPLSRFIDKILTNSADINEFTTYCKTSESKEFILNFGKKILEIEGDLGQGEAEYKLGEFSRNYNVQVNIHKREETNKIANNKYTDAIVINIFANIEEDHTTYGSIYRPNFQEINENNLNCTKDFNKGDYMVSQDFVPISVIKWLLKEFKEYKIEDQSLIESLKESYSQLFERTGDLFEFNEDYNRLIGETESCIKCPEMKAFMQINCGCLVCKPCYKSSIDSNKCGKCGKNLE